MIARCLDRKGSREALTEMGRLSSLYTVVVLWPVRGRNAAAQAIRPVNGPRRARPFNRPLTGTYDLVKIFGALAIACSLPYTTAVKGHVAVEYFFHKLSWRARVVTDTVLRVLGIGLFLMLGWRSVLYGFRLKASGTVALTLRAPLYPIPWLIGVSCFVVSLVIFHNLLHPGQETIKP